MASDERDDNNRNDDLNKEAASVLSPSPNENGITETIKVPFSADLTPSQHAKILRSVVNVLHALLSNGLRYAAIGGGRNAGAGFPIHQQTYTAAANLDAAATTLENNQRQIMTGQLPPNANRIGRA